MSNRSSSVPELPPELVELVVSRLQPFDLARMATISHLFHSLAMNAIIVWGKEHGFELPKGDVPVRSLCLAALMCESSPPALAAAGAQHSFFIDGEGALFCSGRSFDSTRGILGQGCTTFLSAPTRIPSFGRQQVVSVSTSESNALAIAADGSVWSWGGGTHGRLGHGGMERFFTPTRIEAFGETRFVSVSAGSYHSLALDIEGTAWEWGYLNRTQLQLLPKKIDAFRLPIIAISAGQKRSLALTADGCVWSWGVGRDGLLGHGDDSHDPSLPKRIDALVGHRITTVSAAASHSLFLADDGAVFSCGLGYYGKLGLGDSADSKLPTRIEALSGERVVSISAGNFGSLAVTATGEMWRWGRELARNELDQSGFKIRTRPGKMLDAFGGRSVASVTSGPSHSVAVCAGGSYWVWGVGGWQLGLGVRRDICGPERVVL